MAGAGYKLFNTGDVLTAAQVNTYLQEQSVMRFATTAARTTALAGVLAEGMVTYIDATDTVEVYNGSAWVSVAGAASPLTTKGDLYTYSTTNARLGVGNNGESLVADSGTTTGLRWQSNFAAGKNLIINGDFRINQRAFTSNTSTGSYNFDRFLQLNSGTTGTLTVTPQTFTAGSAPVSGYEAINFLRAVTASGASTNTLAQISQRIEDVRTDANSTVTVSFWAKAGSGTPNINVELEQNFGSGGSTAVQTSGTKQAITTSWARYSFTIALPSISGKTIGTSSYLGVNIWLSAGSDFNTRSNTLGLQNATFDIWGVQLETGNTATAFQTATGTLVGELAACQRYFVKFGDTTQAYGVFGTGIAFASTNVDGFINLPVEMRVKPASITYSGCRAMDWTTFLAITSMTIDTPYTNTKMLVVNCVVTGATTKIPYTIGQNNQANDFISVSAEL